MLMINLVTRYIFHTQHNRWKDERAKKGHESIITSNGGKYTSVNCLFIFFSAFSCYILPVLIWLSVKLHLVYTVEPAFVVTWIRLSLPHCSKIGKFQTAVNTNNTMCHIAVTCVMHDVVKLVHPQPIIGHTVNTLSITVNSCMCTQQAVAVTCIMQDTVRFVHSQIITGHIIIITLSITVNSCMCTQ